MEKISSHGATNYSLYTSVHYSFFVFFRKDFDMRFSVARSGFIPPSQQTMDFKFPHDVVCACAKRDEPPSRRRLFQSFARLWLIAYGSWMARLSREADSYRLNRQIMDFKLPHDVVCACAKRDEPPSRRRPSRFPLDQNNILSTNSPERWPTSARHSVSSVYSVDYKKSCLFVCIRG